MLKCGLLAEAHATSIQSSCSTSTLLQPIGSTAIAWCTINCMVYNSVSCFFSLAEWCHSSKICSLMAKQHLIDCSDSMLQLHVLCKEEFLKESSGNSSFPSSSPGYKLF